MKEPRVNRLQISEQTAHHGEGYHYEPFSCVCHLIITMYSILENNFAGWGDIRYFQLYFCRTLLNIQINSK